VGLLSYLVGRRHGRLAAARAVRRGLTEWQQLADEYSAAVRACADAAAELVAFYEAGEDVGDDLRRLARDLRALAP
jgi:hypothetical protein